MSKNIKDILYDSKTNQFKIVIDKNEYFLDYNDFEELKISIDTPVTEDLLKILTNNEFFHKGRKVAINYISYRLRSEKEVRDRLKREQLSQKTVEKIINYLYDNQYLDDDLFTKTFIEDKLNLSNWSLRKIRYELYLKGISDEIIDTYLIDLEDVEYENAYELAEKKLPSWKRRSEDEYELKNRIYRYLAGRGFSYSIVKKVTENLL